MLDALRDAIDELADLDAATLGDGELGDLLVELRMLENRLDAEATRLTGDWDGRGPSIADGARSGAAWLVFRTRISRAAARRRIGLARACCDMPAVMSAWRAGDVDSAHVAVLARALTERTAETFARDEELLVEHARRLGADDFARVVAYWRSGADPDGVEQDQRRLHDQRNAHLAQTYGGAWVGSLLLDPVGGAVVDTTLREIERELLVRDQASGAIRTPGQRRADAFVEMATRARIAPRHGRRPRPLFTVLVGYETFAGRVCELANGAVLAPGALVPWLADADIERVVFDGPSRVLDVGATRRLFDGATRRAVEVRDRNRCYHPTCDVTDHLQVDHVEPWADGGATVQANGRLACGFHNRSRNEPPPPLTARERPGSRGP